MNRTWIKICGIRDAATAQLAADAGANAVGLVFVDGSPRQVTVEQARKIRFALPLSVDAVALFVDTPAAEIRRIAADLDVAYVQLHGRESPADVAALAPLRVIKAVNVERGQVDAAIRPWRQAAANTAAVLFDAPAVGEELPGGLGRCFDWQALASLDRSGLPS